MLSRCIILFFLLSTFLAYIIPLMAAFFFSDIFMYVNGWDEETYLTLQSAKELLASPGYMASAVVIYALQNVGVSGSMQNLLFDFLLIPGMAVCIFFTAVNLGVSKKRSLVYVLFILFSSVLFNYANPYVVDIYGAQRHITTIMPGFESYPSVLRSPQPQISYFLVGLAVLAWSRYRNYFWLLLPLPFLYFFVAVGYSFVIAVLLLPSMFSRYKEKISSGNLLWNVFIPGALLFSISSLFFVLAAYLFEMISGGGVDILFPTAYKETRAFNIPLAFLGLLPFVFLIIYKYVKGVSVGKEGLIFLYVTLSILLIANMHIIAGYTISYKNLHDYSLSLMAGLSLSLFFESVHRHRLVAPLFSNVMQFTLLASILICVLYSQGFNFKESRFRIFVGQTISKDELKMVKHDPLRAIVYSRNLSAKLGYAHAKMPILPFAYQYYFLPYDKTNLDRAMEAVRSYYPEESSQLLFFDKMYESILQRGLPLENVGDNQVLLNQYFFIEPKGNPFIYFP
ncbi:hypothetical protein ACVBE9_01900 [Eionea flava]